MHKLGKLNTLNYLSITQRKQVLNHFRVCNTINALFCSKDFFSAQSLEKSIKTNNNHTDLRKNRTVAWNLRRRRARFRANESAPLAQKTITGRKEREEDKVKFDSEQKKKKKERKKENALSVRSRRHATRKRKNRMRIWSGRVRASTWIWVGRGKCYMSIVDTRQVWSESLWRV